MLAQDHHPREGLLKSESTGNIKPMTSSLKRSIDVIFVPGLTCLPKDNFWGAINSISYSTFEKKNDDF